MVERQHPFRSLNSQIQSFVKFINRTPHCITLYWIDYGGEPVDYGDLLPGESKEINTFVTHPWIFVNRETRDRYLVNQHDVFFPVPWFEQYRVMRRSELPRRIERTNVYIVLPMYTLKELSLKAVKKCLSNDLKAFDLDIPKSLQDEVFHAPPKKKSRPSLVEYLLSD